ncbi:uncharacterized protein ARMOST_19082 [Armillaria ostoyae]|uniref:Uncharacterized protein n=1 Tax=Armillaria ostoyae TaxID=47428 RepID=A0A284S3J6_ARMOS|nr:uncharacterized protein ARMOST_19082 [Armillaria ostoyae]
MKEYHYEPRDVLLHGSYLINLGNPDAEKRQKSYEYFLDDLNRCEQLGLEVYNSQIIPTISVVTVLENMVGSGYIKTNPELEPVWIRDLSFLGRDDGMVLSTQICIITSFANLDRRNVTWSFATIGSVLRAFDCCIQGRVWAGHREREQEGRDADDSHMCPSYSPRGRIITFMLGPRKMFMIRDALTPLVYAAMLVQTTPRRILWLAAWFSRHLVVLVTKILTPAPRCSSDGDGSPSAPVIIFAGKESEAFTRQGNHRYLVVDGF